MKSAYYTGSLEHMATMLSRETEYQPRKDFRQVSLFGLDVILDASMPVNTIEFRNGDGKVLARVISGDEGWIGMLRDAWRHEAVTAPKIAPSVDLASGIDIGLPTPVEVAVSLGEEFSHDQAAAIAAEVYQPLRDMLRHLVLLGVRR